MSESMDRSVGKALLGGHFDEENNEETLPWEEEDIAGISYQNFFFSEISHFGL